MPMVFRGTPQRAKRGDPSANGPPKENQKERYPKSREHRPCWAWKKWAPSFGELALDNHSEKGQPLSGSFGI